MQLLLWHPIAGIVGIDAPGRFVLYKKDDLYVVWFENDKATGRYDGFYSPSLADALKEFARRLKRHEDYHADGTPWMLPLPY